ncbi:MAG: hypothetical protein HY902_09475 [Deltaproteobacteria bacterium]|nr:hypothetical protein [Deltaproteobacteria bacterium]
MQVRILLSITLAGWCLGSPAQADPEPVSGPAEPTPAVADEPKIEVRDTAEEAPLLSVRSSGFLDMRWTGGYASVGHLVPANDTPHLQELTEGNVQLKLSWADKAQALVDASFIHQRAWMYWGQNAAGERTRLADHDVATFRPAALIAEAYGIYNLGERLNLTLGKKRVLWGPGLAWNPTDLLNPPKDPTDPTLQRAGAWLARLELPMDSWSLSLVGAAKTTRQFAGIPSGLVWYPDNQPAGETRDDRPHFALAARLYALVAETDLNAMFYLTQLYNDTFEYKPRLGLTASHVFWNALEVHAEVLGQLGSSRTYVDGDCVSSLGKAMVCFSSGKPVARTSLADDDGIRVKALAGARYQFGENAAISAEYFYNAEGYNAEQFGNFVTAASYRQQAAKAGVPIDVISKTFGSMMPSAGDPGSPQKFAFEPLRRHYLFLTYMHPQLADDFTINTVVILGLADGSGQVAPQLTWSARAWCNLSAGAFITLPGIESRGAQVGGQGYTEYGLQPSLWRAFASIRVFY